MAWTAPKTWVGGEVPTASVLNAQLRDNMLETMPAKATVDGDIFVGNGANSIVARQIQAQRISAFESTSSTSYTNLSTVGPEVTVTHGTHAIIFWSCQLQNNGASNASFMSWAMSGSNSRSAFDTISITQDGVLASNPWRVGNIDIHQTLTPGTTTFTAKYRCSAGTSDFSDRFLAVIPL